MGWVMFIGYVIELGGLGTAAYSLAMHRVAEAGPSPAEAAAAGVPGRGPGSSRPPAVSRPPRVRERSARTRGVVRRRGRQAASRARALLPERERWSWIGLSLAAFGLLLQGIATWGTWG